MCVCVFYFVIIFHKCCVSNLIVNEKVVKVLNYAQQSPENNYCCSQAQKSCLFTDTLDLNNFFFWLPNTQYEAFLLPFFFLNKLGLDFENEYHKMDSKYGLLKSIISRMFTLFSIMQRKLDGLLPGQNYSKL